MITSRSIKNMTNRTIQYTSRCRWDTLLTLPCSLGCFLKCLGSGCAFCSGLSHLLLASTFDTFSFCVYIFIKWHLTIPCFAWPIIGTKFICLSFYPTWPCTVALLSCRLAFLNGHLWIAKAYKLYIVSLLGKYGKLLGLTWCTLWFIVTAKFLFAVGNHFFLRPPHFFLVIFFLGLPTLVP